MTGAGRGIGKFEALGLAAEGAAVVVNDFGGGPDGGGGDKGPADEVEEEIKKAGGQAVANHGNVASFKEAEAMVRQAIESFGRLDILVNNAGILRDRMIFNMTEEEWDAVMAVHLKGHFNLTRHTCAVFRQQRSGVITMLGGSNRPKLRPGERSDQEQGGLGPGGGRPKSSGGWQVDLIIDTGACRMTSPKDPPARRLRRKRAFIVPPF